MKFKSLFFLTFLGHLSFSQSDSLYFDILGSSLEDFLTTEVLTASKGKDKLSNAPASIFVIDQQEIQRRGWKYISDVLEFIPGFEIQRKSQAEINHNYSVRGITGVEKFIILYDGVRINSGTGTSHQVDQNFSVANVEKVEVILGPASALYGVDAFSGVINIIPKKYEGQSLITINSNYGNYNTSNVNFGLVTAKKGFEISLNGSYSYSNEPFFPDYYSEEFDWYTNNYSTNGTVGLPFDPNVNWPVDIEKYATPTKAYNWVGSIKYKNLELGNSNNYESSNTSFGMHPRYAIYSKNAVRNFGINTTWLKHEVSGEKWKLNSVILAQKLELKPESRFINFFSNYQDGFKYSKDNVFKLEETFSYDINATNKLIFGGTAEYDIALANTSDLPSQYNTKKSADEQNINYLGSEVNDKNGNDLSIKQKFYETEYQNFSLYGQYKTTFKEKVHVTLGSRFDHNSRYGNSVNPRLGIVYAPQSKFQIKYLFGSAYLAPSPFKTFKHYGSFSLNSDSTGLTSSFFHLPNPDLKPEHLLSHEVNFNYIINSSLVISGNSFYNQITNLITNELSFGEEFQGVIIDAVQRNVNNGFSETFGGSISLKGDFAITNKLMFKPTINYTYTDGHIDGGQLLYTAKNKVQAEFAFAYKKLFLSISTLYRDQSFGSINGSITSNDEFVVLNSNIGFRMLEKPSYTLSLSSQINNLLNSKYYHLAKDNDLITMQTIPQDPIRLNLGLTLDFH